MATTFESTFGTPKPKLVFAFYSRATFHGLSVSYEDENGGHIVVGRVERIVLDSGSGDDAAPPTKKIMFRRGILTAPWADKHAQDVAALTSAGFIVEYHDDPPSPQEP